MIGAVLLREQGRSGRGAASADEHVRRRHTTVLAAKITTIRSLRWFSVRRSSSFSEATSPDVISNSWTAGYQGVIMDDFLPVETYSSLDHRGDHGACHHVGRYQLRPLLSSDRSVLVRRRATSGTVIRPRTRLAKKAMGSAMSAASSTSSG